MSEAAAEAEAVIAADDIVAVDLDIGRVNGDGPKQDAGKPVPSSGAHP